MQKINRNLLLNISLIFISSFVILLVLFLFLEIYLRFDLTESSVYELLQPSLNEILFHELKPNLNVEWHGDHIRIPPTRVITNSIGIRDEREFSITKPNDTIRIVGIGDSLMYGFGVNNNEAFLFHLEKLLNQTLKYNIEIMNFAVPAYNTEAEVETLKKKALKYDPDIVIILWVDNDYCPMLEFNKKILWYDQILYHSWAYKYVIKKRLKNVCINLNLCNEKSETEYSLTEGIERSKEALISLGNLSREYNFLTIFVKYPQEPYLPNLPRFEEIEQIVKEEGFVYIDLADLYDGYDMNLIWNKGKREPHPNAFGHNLIAHRLYHEFLNKRLIKDGKK